MVNHKTVSNGKAGLILAGLVLAAVGGLYLLVPAFASQLKSAFSILDRADTKALRIYLHAFGGWAPLVSMALMVLQALVAPLPALVITFANARVFGWVWGAVYSWTGALAGASLCFWIAQALGRPVVERLVGKRSLGLWDDFFQRYGWYSIVIARLIPVAPFDMISYGAGLTSLGFWEFFWATGIGQLPATLVYAWFGENITQKASYAFWAVCGFMVLLFFSLAIRQRLRHQMTRDSGDGL